MSFRFDALFDSLLDVAFCIHYCLILKLISRPVVIFEYNYDLVIFFTGHLRSLLKMYVE